MEKNELIVGSDKLAGYLGLLVMDDEFVDVLQQWGMIGLVPMLEHGGDIMSINPCYEVFGLGAVSAMPQHLDSRGRPQWIWNMAGIELIVELLRRLMLRTVSADYIPRQIEELCCPSSSPADSFHAAS